MTELTRRQFVTVQFKPWDRQTYTYHNDGEFVDVGDQVIVETKRGPATVTVTRVGADAPSFETKPIVGKAPTEKPAEQEAR